MSQILSEPSTTSRGQWSPFQTLPQDTQARAHLARFLLAEHVPSQRQHFPNHEPQTILTGTTADYATHCHVPIGAYCKVHNENDLSNTKTPCTTSYAIALNPTRNLQGSYHFLSLTTGKTSIS